MMKVCWKIELGNHLFKVRDRRKGKDGVEKYTRLEKHGIAIERLEVRTRMES